MHVEAVDFNLLGTLKHIAFQCPHVPLRARADAVMLIDKYIVAYNGYNDIVDEVFSPALN